MLCARLKPISYSPRESVTLQRRGWLSQSVWAAMGATFTWLLQILSTGCSGPGCAHPWSHFKLLRSAVAAGTGHSDPAASNLGALLKNLETHNNINPTVPAWGDDTHFFTEVLLSAPHFPTLTLVHWEPEHWTRMKGNGRALLKADYIYFSTHPPVADVSTEKGILLSFLSP